MKNLTFLFILLFTAACRHGSYNQENQLYIPVNFQKSYEQNTRSMDGKPGEAYWQNRADYHINIRLKPGKRLLTGNQTIWYYNNSPDTLYSVLFHLFPNYYRAGNPRDERIRPEDAEKGIQLRSLKIKYPENYDFSLFSYDTQMEALLNKGIAPGDSIEFEIGWQYLINKGSHNRTGMVDETTCFVAYFFPRIAVYDDIDGWNRFNYTGLIEFYNDFGDFEVNIEVPENYLVWATGLLQNPEEVLRAKYAKRYRKAFESDDIIPIVDKSEYLTNVTLPNKTNTWKFNAENVTDFAFGASNHYLWDATSLIVDTVTGRRVLIEAAFNPLSEDFYKVAYIARKSVEFMSFEIPGYPFPFPNITVFNGLSEMEYPMMVNDHSLTDIHETIKLTSHEIFHSYFPFLTGLNETKYAWMDEGWASYGDYIIGPTIDTTLIPRIFSDDIYQKYAGTDWDVPLMTNTAIMREPTYWSNSYQKSAAFLEVLRIELGDELFKQWILEFIHRWKGKHPTPYDYFNTLNDVVGENMNWLIEPWFYEYGYMDLVIQMVEDNAIIIDNEGGFPVPLHLKVMYTDSSIAYIEKKPSVWKKNRESTVISLETKKKIKSLEVSGGMLPDVHPENNRYPK